MGSQWSFTRIGLLWSNLRAPHTKRAAMFCSSWSFLSWYWVIHKKESYSCNERAHLNFTIRFLCRKPRYNFLPCLLFVKGVNRLSFSRNNFNSSVVKLNRRLDLSTNRLSSSVGVITGTYPWPNVLYPQEIMIDLADNFEVHPVFLNSHVCCHLLKYPDLMILAFVRLCFQ